MRRRMAMSRWCRGLLAAKADVNAKDYIGRTALMLASEAGRDEVVKLLRQAGAKE
jgi:ankyrin repeat protein